MLEHFSIPPKSIIARSEVLPWYLLMVYYQEIIKDNCWRIKVFPLSTHSAWIVGMDTVLKNPGIKWTFSISYIFRSTSCFIYWRSSLTHPFSMSCIFRSMSCPISWYSAFTHPFSINCISEAQVALSLDPLRWIINSAPAAFSSLWVFSSLYSLCWRIRAAGVFREKCDKNGNLLGFVWNTYFLSFWPLYKYFYLV